MCVCAKVEVKGEMGKVIERIKIQNLLDPAKQVELDAVVDTGATLLALPLNLVGQLGLQKFREVTMRYANNHTEKKNVYGVVTVEIQGRAGHFDVLGEEPGSQPLIGQLVLEELDLVVNPLKRSLAPNPQSPDMPMVEMLGCRSSPYVAALSRRRTATL
jgi:predicted aspartyl protease